MFCYYLQHLKILSKCVKSAYFNGIFLQYLFQKVKIVMMRRNILQYLTKMLRQYFICTERLEIFLTCFCNILCYVGSFNVFYIHENTVFEKELRLVIQSPEKFLCVIRNFVIKRFKIRNVTFIFQNFKKKFKNVKNCYFIVSLKVNQFRIVILIIQFWSLITSN